MPPGAVVMAQPLFVMRCACGSTVRGTCIHATRGGKSVVCCMCIL